MDKKVETAFNKQINAELYSAYLYLSMSAWFTSIGLKGIAAWERVQAQEERDHAMILYDYVLSAGGKITATNIKAPKTEWGSPKEAFEFQLAHEKQVTASINNVIEIAQSAKDHASIARLQWFITEQVEEEQNVRDILDQIALIADSPTYLYMLDKDLGTRTYTPATGQYAPLGGQ
jgi:ferritin